MIGGHDLCCSGIQRVIRYPMRISDFRSFGFTDQLFPEGNAPAED